jgi:hypothetical protein
MGGQRLPLVHRQGADLGKWHTESLNDMAESGCPVTDRMNPAEPVPRRQEEAKLGGEVKLELRAVHDSSMPDLAGNSFTRG